MRWSGASAGLRTSARPRCSPVGCCQSTGTERVAHWKPSPQSLHTRVASNAGSGAHVVVVVVVEEVLGLGFGFAPAGTASAIATTPARQKDRSAERAERGFTARPVRPTGAEGRASPD